MTIRKWVCAVAGAATVVSLAPSVATAGDQCRFYEGDRFDGASLGYALLSDPEATYSEYAWGNTGVRRTGLELRNDWYADDVVYRSASSLRVVAGATPVTLYLYTGDNFDGMVYALRCSQGYTCLWSLDGHYLDNRVRSFMCQREFPESGETLEVTELPTEDIAGEIHTTMKQELSSADDVDGFWGNTTRLYWSTSESRCRGRTGDSSNLCATSEWQRKYTDEMRVYHFYYADMDLPGSDSWYDDVCNNYVHMYIRPVLDGERLAFRAPELRVFVRDCHFSDTIRDELESAIQPEYDDIPLALYQAYYDAVLAETGSAWLTDLVLGYRERLQLTHTFVYGDQYVAESGIGLSSDQQSAPWYWGIPTGVYAPILRMNVDRALP